MLNVHKPHHHRVEDLASTDEVTVYKDEGEEEEQTQSEENLSEDKLGLVPDEEEAPPLRGASSSRTSHDSFWPGLSSRLSPFSLWGYPRVPPGLPWPPPGIDPALLLSASAAFYRDRLLTPPPAHTGVSPFDIKPPPMSRPLHPFPIHPSKLPSLYPPDMKWSPSPTPSPLNFSLPFHPAMMQSPLARYSAGSPLFPPFTDPHDHHPFSRLSPGSADHNRFSIERLSGQESNLRMDGVRTPTRKKPHVKKPLNAFMLFMKENRAEVIKECTLKESAAINQILGQKWHSLSKEEQQKYYEMAKKEKELHAQLYPGWSARDNYAMHSKRKKRKKEVKVDKDCPDAKKCRARFGIDRSDLWCEHCKRKKRCLRFAEEAGEKTSDEQPSPSISNDAPSEIKPLPALHIECKGDATDPPPPPLTSGSEASSKPETPELAKMKLGIQNLFVNPNSQEPRSEQGSTNTEPVNMTTTFWNPANITKYMEGRKTQDMNAVSMTPQTKTMDNPASPFSLPSLPSPDNSSADSGIGVSSPAING